MFCPPYHGVSIPYVSLVGHGRYGGSSPFKRPHTHGIRPGYADTIDHLGPDYGSDSEPQM